MPKKKVQCPNPLFLQWLEEWKSEAEERSLNSKYTFLKVSVLFFFFHQNPHSCLKSKGTNVILDKYNRGFEDGNESTFLKNQTKNVFFLSICP